MAESLKRVLHKLGHFSFVVEQSATTHVLTRLGLARPSHSEWNEQLGHGLPTPPNMATSDLERGGKSQQPAGEVGGGPSGTGALLGPGVQLVSFSWIKPA